MLPPTLFDSSYRQWVSDPELAFESWLSRWDIKKDSMAIYIWMWRKFCRWMALHGYCLHTLAPAQLGQFIQEEQLLKTHGYRYVRLIERVYQHLLHLPDAPPNALNPASAAAKQRVAAGRNDPTGFYSIAERQTLARLIETGQLEEGKPDKPFGQGINPEQWQWRRERDLALLGVFLGGGLKVHEAVGLTVSCVVLPGRLQLPYSPKTRGGDRDGDAGAGGFARQVKLASFAAVALQRWLARLGAQSGDAVLFPSNEKGGALDASNVFRRVKELLALAGLAQRDGARSCGQTLRNSYAATLLDQDTPVDEIALLMGWTDTVTVGRFRFAYENWLNRQAGLPDLAEADDEMCA